MKKSCEVSASEGPFERFVAIAEGHPFSRPVPKAVGDSLEAVDGCESSGDREPAVRVPATRSNRPNPVTVIG
jgi:hypothetical protein